MNLKYIFIILFIILQVPCQAQQEMSVAGFKLLENDLTAMRQGTQKEDVNGNTAALIKIVTIEKGFTFDGGTLGVVATEYKTGEIWVYVPERAQRITISHPTFGVLRNYTYPVPIVGGRTYEMLLDIGAGRYVTLNAAQADADVEVDGKFAGKSPVYNHYLTYGRHTIKAQNGRFEGVNEVFISGNERKDTMRIIHIDMQDMSHLYGDVTVTVDNSADIYFQGRLVGTGRWHNQLKEGVYEVETSKADCDPVKTQFTVKARQQNNITATPPTPHVGWLQVYTRPGNVKSYPYDLSETKTLPVGTYQIEFWKNGYISQYQEYTVRRNEITRDTVTLERVTYVKPFAFYFGGAYTLRSLMGATGIVGAVYQRHDLQASYTFGLNESEAVYWGGDMNTATRYKMNSIGVKYGYQFNLMRQLALTPQVGYSYNFLSANAAQSGNTTYGDGTSSQTATIGAKIVFVPMQHLYCFAAPEFMFSLSREKYFKTITDSSNLSDEGFAVHIGLLVNF